jgi:TorA maturation chaperone TorD
MLMVTDRKEHNMLKGYNMLLYFAGTMIMFDPEQECINDFWKQGILKSLPVSSQNPRFIKASSQLHESVGDQNSNIKMMSFDYKSLFIGNSTPLAPPFESVYTINDYPLNERQRSEVLEFYNSYGWESSHKGKIAEDHLGIELLFLTLMIEKYLEMDDEACNSEMKNEIRRFINSHLLSWVPEWNERIQNNANTISYKGIGTLILACIEDIYSIMGQNNTKYN